MRDLLILVGAGASSLLTTVWHHVTHRNREIRAHREMCNHQWTEPYEVAAHYMGFPPHFYKSRCPACGLDKHVNEDGSTYIPAREKKEEDWL